MPPSVRIESKAWDDPAFAILANRLGMPDPDLALIKCGRIWAYCTEHNNPKVSVELVDAITRTPSFASAMVFAKLATFCDEDAAVLVAGATGKNRNRIAWLATKRKNSRKGGSANGAKWGATREPIGSGSAVPKGSPNTNAPAPANTLSTPIAPDGGPGQEGLFGPLPTKGRRAKKRALLDWHRAAAMRVWEFFDRARLDAIPGSRSLTPIDANLQRIAERLEHRTEDDCKRVVQCYALRAKRDPAQRQWFNAETPFVQANFERTLSMADAILADQDNPAQPASDLDRKVAEAEARRSKGAS